MWVTWRSVVHSARRVIDVALPCSSEVTDLVPLKDIKLAARAAAHSKTATAAGAGSSDFAGLDALRVGCEGCQSWLDGLPGPRRHETCLPGRLA